MSARLAMRVALAAALAAGWAFGARAEGEHSALRTSLRTVEGTVAAVSSRPAEGNLDVVAVTLDTGDAGAKHLELLLAPQQVLDEISFGIEEGDRLRARVFVDDQGPLKVHKAMNLTRGTMVRFRSLRKIPLWGREGNWEGGSCRRQGGHGGSGGGPRR
jgi:hypothetical protein